MDKEFLEALRKVKEKQLDEATPAPRVKPTANPDPKNYGFFSKNNQSPYGFARGGSDDDSAANFFASDKRMRDAQQAAPAPAAPKVKPRTAAPVPLPPRIPSGGKIIGSQGPEGAGNILSGKTASPVAPASTGEAGVKKADEILKKDREIESGSKTPATTSPTSRSVGIAAAKSAISNPADERARAGMSDEKKKEIDDQAAARQSQIDSERTANLAKQAEIRSQRETSSTSTPTPTARPSTDTEPTAQSKKRSAIQSMGSEERSESGPNKGKKKMSESLIDAFLKLQTSGGNLFSEAKKLKGDQHKLDKNQNGKLDSQDFKMLRGEKVEEAKKADKDYDGDGKVESSKDEVWGSRFKAAKKAGKMEESNSNKPNTLLKPSTTSDPDFAVPSANPDAPKSPIKFVPEKEKPKKTNEEVTFSEDELAHFEAVIARKDQKGKERGIGDTVDSADLTDEYVMEMARGVKAGTKRGSYKKKATDLAGNKVAGADAATDESDKGIPHVLDQIRSAKENEKGHITLKDHDSDPANPKTASVHRKVARDFYSDYHNTEKPADKNAKLASFKSKVFG